MRALAFLVLLGLVGTVQAHPVTAHGQVTIGNGPLTLGLNLGRLYHDRHHRHAHGPVCYRKFPRGHAHWHGGGWHDRPYRHARPHHLRPRRDVQRDHPRRGHRGHARHHRQDRRHDHQRFCYLQYPRGHAHWR